MIFQFVCKLWVNKMFKYKNYIICVLHISDVAGGSERKQIMPYKIMEPLQLTINSHNIMIIIIEILERGSCLRGYI